MKKRLNVLMIFLISSLVISCGLKPVKFNPEFYASDYENEQIVFKSDEQTISVKCNEERFNDFFSMEKEKVAELISILSVAKVPRSFKKKRDLLVRKLIKAGGF